MSEDTAYLQDSIKTDGTHEIEGWRTVNLRILRPPSLVQSRERFKVLQQYEGFVISIAQDSFWARLVDKGRRPL